MKNKVPKTLDPDEIFNKLFRVMNDTYDAAERIYYNKDFSCEEKLVVISHSAARACGIADAIRTLGYEVRNSDGMLLTQTVCNKFYGLKQRAELDEKAERKGACK